MKKIKKLSTLWVLTLMLAGAIGLIRMPIWAAAETFSDINLKVSQAFTIKNGTATIDSFTYKLTAKDNTNPMPQGSRDGVYDFSIKGSTSANISMSFPEEGTYRYKLEQVVDTAKEGYNYEKKTYNIAVYVSTNEQDEQKTDVIVKNAAGEKVSEIKYTNVYDKPDVVKPTEKPSTPSTPTPTPAKPNTTVKTGDTSNLAGWAVVAVLAGACFTGFLFWEKRNKKGQNRL